MELTIPTVLKTLSTSGSAARSISDWWSKSKGENRALIGELKDNLIYLDMVANDDIPLEAVIDKLSPIQITGWHRPRPLGRKGNRTADLFNL